MVVLIEVAMTSGMTLWGWIFMLVGWGICFGLTLFCIRRILRDSFMVRLRWRWP